jgi:hypothetical protein
MSHRHERAEYRKQCEWDRHSGYLDCTGNAGKRDCSVCIRRQVVAIDNELGVKAFGGTTLLPP